MLLKKHCQIHNTAKLISALSTVTAVQSPERFTRRETDLSSDRVCARQHREVSPNTVQCWPLLIGCLHRRRASPSPLREKAKFHSTSPHSNHERSRPLLCCSGWGTLCGTQQQLHRDLPPNSKILTPPPFLPTFCINEPRLPLRGSTAAEQSEPFI